MAKTKRKMRRKLKWIISCAVTVYVAVMLIQKQEQMRDQAAQMAAIRDQMAQAQATNEQLERDIAFAKTDEYIENAARDKLGWVRENEVIFMEDN